MEADLRAVLRAAIDKRDAAVLELEALRASYTRATQMLEKAEAKHEEACAAVEAAREEHTERVAEAASTGKPLKADGAIRAAREAELTAADELDAARAAAARFAAALDFPRTFTGKSLDPVSIAEADVDRAINDVIRSELDIEARIKRAGELFAECYSLRVDLIDLLRENLVPVEHVHSLAEVLRPVNMPAVTLGGAGGRNLYNFNGSPALALMRAALKSDPDAPLPISEPAQEAEAA